MRRTARLLGSSAALALVAVSVASASAPNQGNPAFVVKADNRAVSCKYPKPGPKVEGKFGRTVSVSGSGPIDFVTLKSGKGASVVSKAFYGYKGKVTLSKDVSNYVVWTCPKY